MSRYRRVDVCVWTDQKFRKLPDPGPNARMLWLHLLTTPLSLPIPGVIVSGPAGIAEAIGWPLGTVTGTMPEPLREPFEQLLANGFLKVDFDARLIWLHKSLRRNPPANPNVVRGWAKCWPDVPECALKGEIRRALKPFVERFGLPFEQLFGAGFEYDPPQDQDQEQEREREGFSLSGDLFPEGSVANMDAVQALADQIWAEQESSKATLRATGIDEDGRPLPPTSPLKNELVARIRESAGNGRGILAALEDCRHVLAVGIDEARRKKTLRYLDGNHWRAERFARHLNQPLLVRNGKRDPLSAFRDPETPAGVTR